MRNILSTIKSQNSPLIQPAATELATGIFVPPLKIHVEFWADDSSFGWDLERFFCTSFSKLELK